MVGQTVRGREDIIYLPTADTTKADIKVHESSLKKIKLGQRAVVKVDALPDATFTGTIAKISPLPDNNWMNPDINKYPCEIFIDDNEYDLKNGMNCRCEILIEALKDVLYVPLQAVIQVGDEYFVEVRQGKEFVRRKVEIGLDDNKLIHIISGLEEGESVSLTPKLKDTEVKAKSVFGEFSGEFPEGAGTNGMAPTAGQGGYPGGGAGMGGGMGGGAGMGPGGQRPQGGNAPTVTPEALERLQNMTPEERQAMMERFQGQGGQGQRPRRNTEGAVQPQ